MSLWRLTQRTLYANQIACLSTFHFLGPADPGPTAQDLCNDWAINIVPTWKANTSNALAWTLVQAYSLYPGGADEGQTVLTGNSTMLITPPPPSVIAGVMTWRTAQGGRRRRGRTYVVGVPWANSNGYNWGSNGLTALNNIANAIYTRYQLGGNPHAFELAVYSRLEGGSVPPVFLSAARVVRGFSIQPYIATMGTRRGGRGM